MTTAAEQRDSDSMAATANQCDRISTTTTVRQQQEPTATLVKIEPRDVDHLVLQSSQEVDLRPHCKGVLSIHL